MKRFHIFTRSLLVVIMVLAMSAVISAAPKYEADVTQPTVNGTLKGFEKHRWGL